MRTWYELHIFQVTALSHNLIDGANGEFPPLVNIAFQHQELRAVLRISTSCVLLPCGGRLCHRPEQIKAHCSLGVAVLAEKIVASQFEIGVFKWAQLA